MLTSWWNKEEINTETKDYTLGSDAFFQLALELGATEKPALEAGRCLYHRHWARTWGKPVRAGMFDISHVGKFFMRGETAPTPAFGALRFESVCRGRPGSVLLNPELGLSTTPIFYYQGSGHLW